MHIEENKMNSQQIEAMDIYTRTSLEYIKLGSEFSKIIVGNLALLNIGGLASIPVLIGLSAKDKADVWEKLVIFGLPALLFIFGFCLANLCALFVYRNFNVNAVVHRLTLEKIVRDLETVGAPALSQELGNGSLPSNIRDYIDKSRQEYRRAHLVGWASFLIFACGLVRMIFKIVY